MNQTTVYPKQKRGRGRPKKIYEEGELPSKKTGLPVLLEPTIHDIKEELSMMDSYSSRYNQ